MVPQLARPDDQGARVVRGVRVVRVPRADPGSLGTVFGVCANAWSPDDGKVVSLDHGCGALRDRRRRAAERLARAGPAQLETRVEVVPHAARAQEAHRRARGDDARRPGVVRGRPRRLRSRRGRRPRGRAGRDRDRPGAVTFDALGTAALRAAVLGAWRASPARLREDANTEEDHARGYYRDRLVEFRAERRRRGGAGRDRGSPAAAARTRADDGTLVLVAANLVLDEAGVASLASMRASSRRPDGGTADRQVVEGFGVGFAAVRAVSDEVSVVDDGRRAVQPAGHGGYAGGGVGGVPALADEVRRRDGSLPALRVPCRRTVAARRGTTHGGGAGGARRGRGGRGARAAARRSTTRCCWRCRRWSRWSSRT